MPDDPLFAGIATGASGMSAERLRMTVAAENLANAGNTRPLADGRPYQRQRVVFREELDRAGRATGRVTATVVRMPKYTQRYEPDHPDADDAGIVKEPDISPILELTDLMVASRAYQANANAIKGLLGMHEQALRIGDAL